MSVQEQGLRFVEGEPDQAWLVSASDINDLIGTCLGEDIHVALLYGPNLPPAFFDLSTGVAGEILQKLRNYHIRLALVCPPGQVRFSTRFHELLADEQRGSYFGVFETRPAAIAWIAQG